MPINAPRSKAKHRSIEPNRTFTKVALPTLCVIVGMLLMLYPVVSTLWNNHATNKVAEEYAAIEQSLPEEVKNEQWEKAHEYNANHTPGPILDPWIGYVVGKTPEYDAYLEQLNANQAMARLVIPSIEVDLPIYHGIEEDTLQKGLGHLYGSELPVGGPGTHSIITGHTGLPNATLFDNLRKVKEGDAFFIAVAGHKIKYVVDRISTVLPHQVEELTRDSDKEGDYVTLVTCTPYGINTHRLLVRAHAEPITASEAKALEDAGSTVWTWWMYAVLAAIIVIALALAWWLRKRVKDRPVPLSKAQA